MRTPLTGPVLLGLAGGNIGKPGTTVLFLIPGIAIIVCTILLIRKDLDERAGGDSRIPARQSAERDLIIRIPLARTGRSCPWHQKGTRFLNQDQKA